MKAPISRGFAVLLLAGALAVLLLGAFARFDSGTTDTQTAPQQSTVVAAMEPAGDPQLPPNLSPGLAEIIRMAQAHVDQNVVLDFIRNSGQTYSPSADEILYLSDLGLSQTVIAALFPQKTSAGQEVAAATPAPISTPVPTLPSLGTNGGVFYNALAPYGSWTQVPNYGICWQPTAETVNPDWRPYVDQGQWLYTDNGWYWQSGYSWGWAPFHYGRWTKTSSLGWVWVPNNVWGPSWVSWRIALTYSGWAPLPPGVGLAAGGLTFDNRHVTADSDLGLPAGWFTFVAEGNILSEKLPTEAVPLSQAAEIYNRSLGVNNYYIANDKIVAQGPGRPKAAIASENEPGPLLAENIPARKIEPLTEPKAAPVNDLPPLTGRLASAESVDTMVSQSADVLAAPLPQVTKFHHRHHAWPEDYAAYSARPAPPRWPPPGDREFLRPDHNPEPPNEALVREPARMEAPFVSTSSKAGK